MRPPHWWQTENGALLPKYLNPIGRLYGQIVKARFRYTTPFQSRLPVICVGNFTLGGTGKTPLSLKLAQMLQKEGWHPTFLSRGYGGKIKGPLLVDPSGHSASEVGDEPLLLAATAPTVIAKTRAEGAWLIEQRKTTDLIIMDDGFQNPSLSKTLSLVCLDAATGFGNGRIFPAGPLRAPLNDQLAMSDAIIITGNTTNQFKQELRQTYKFDKPIFEGLVRPENDTNWRNEKPILAYAGIAQPEKLFNTLTEAGGKVIRRIPFPDHYQLKPKDAAHLIELALKDDLQLVTTEKDLVRIDENEHHQLRALKRMSRPLPVSFHFADDDERKLTALVKKAINKIENKIDEGETT